VIRRRLPARLLKKSLTSTALNAPSESLRTLPRVWARAATSALEPADQHWLDTALSTTLSASFCPSGGVLEAHSNTKTAQTANSETQIHLGCD